MSSERFHTADLTIAQYLEGLSSGEAVPGGGSVAAIAGAMAAGLVQMVATLSLDRPRYAAYEQTIRDALQVADRARQRLLELADEDVAAFADYMAARRAAGAAQTTGESYDPVRRAARRATDVPLEVVRAAADVAAVIESLAGRSNLNAASDLGVAAELVEAAARGAGANVLINLPAVRDERLTGAITADLNGYLGTIQHLTRQTREHLGRGQLREPERAPHSA